MTTTDLPPPPAAAPPQQRSPQGQFLRWYSAGPADAATRHLSAGAYLDEEFARTGVRDVHDEPRRLVAPSYGFDLPTVLHHCRRARRSYLFRDLALSTLLLLGLCTIIGAPVVLSVIAVLSTQFYLVAFWRLVKDVARQVRSAEYTGSLRALLRLGMFALLSVVMVPVILLVFTTVLAALGIAALAGMSGTGSDAGGTGFMFLVSTILLFCVVYGLTVGPAIWRQSQLDLLAPGHTPTRPAPSARLSDIAAQEAGNVTVYSGPRPFIGSGIEVGRWGAAVRMVHAPRDQMGAASTSDNGTWAEGQEFETPPFDITELVDFVGHRLGRLAYDQTAQHHLPGLTVEPRVFLAGTEVAGLHPRLPAEDVVHVMRHPTAPARHYLACRVVAWRGTLVTHVYLSYAVQGRALYTELTAYALPPCRPEFQVVDKVGGTGPVAHLRTAWRSFVDTPAQVARAPINCVRAALDLLAAGKRDLAAAAATPGYDHGAELSLRELGSGPLYEQSMHFHDVHKTVKIIERQAVAATYEFLESKGVDITEYRQRFTSILNNGVWNNGNMNLGGGNALGPGAQVTNNGGGKGA